MSFVIRRASVEVGSFCYVGTLSYPYVQSKKERKKTNLVDPRFDITDFGQQSKRLGHPPRGIIVKRSGRSFLIVKHRGKVSTSREKLDCREAFYILVMSRSGGSNAFTKRRRTRNKGAIVNLRTINSKRE